MEDGGRSVNAPTGAEEKLDGGWPMAIPTGVEERKRCGEDWKMRAVREAGPYNGAVGRLWRGGSLGVQR